MLNKKYIRKDGSFYWRKGNWMLYLNKKNVQKVQNFSKNINPQMIEGLFSKGLQISKQITNKLEEK